MSTERRAIRQIPPLSPEELQLWRVEIGDASDLLPSYISLLTTEEWDTAARRRDGQVREQFAFGRGCLRILLGKALQLNPRDVPIQTGVNGKLLTPEIEGRGVSYNIAHSRDTILIALRQHGAVGVDLEHIDCAIDVMEVAQAWFTERESSILASLDDPEGRCKLFYRYWTRKEAVAKADGRGLLLPPTSFDVEFKATEQKPAEVHIPLEDTSKPYLVRDIHLGAELSGALALESPDSEITRWIFPLAALAGAIDLGP